MIEPLYSADEMRAAEALYPGYPDTAAELMEVAAAAVAEHLVAAATRRPGGSRRSAAEARTAATGGSQRRSWLGAAAR